MATTEVLGHGECFMKVRGKRENFEEEKSGLGTRPSILCVTLFVGTESV